MPPRARATKAAAPKQAAAPAIESTKSPTAVFAEFLTRLHDLTGEMLATLADAPPFTPDPELSPSDQAAADYEHQGFTEPDDADSGEPETEAEEPAKPAAAKKAAPAAKRASPAAKRAPAKAKPEPEPEPADPEDMTAEEYAAELAKLSLSELRDLAISLDYAEDAVAEAEQFDLIESILSEKYPNADATTIAQGVLEAGSAAAGDPDDAEEAEDDAQPITAEELRGMSKGALRKLCQQVELPKEQWDSLDEDGLVELLTNYQAGETDAEEGDDAEDEGEGEEQVWTREDLETMSRAQLLGIAADYGVPKADIPKNATPKQLVDLIFQYAEAEDDSPE